jgi:single-strand DNA-binding protein
MSAATVATEYEHSNEVHLVGRVAAAPDEIELPSGDLLVKWRLIIDRPPRERHSRASVDVLECSAYLAKIRRTASKFDPGDIVEVDGALRRRFYPTPGGQKVSRYSVEVTAVRRLSRGG